ncbi:hypothetical protein BJF85_06065 [Saccharomonospora sp. CUA-673]|uniref:hypothetical protein n=1 Tax=Saccharomonospora sp. CUA-673 TaxID=1904969 RepID=UPI0009590D88|nr:hypothetical protein [Saccharomonospora sp. CUA-673]OLT40682.1 hypothetical protein BJF85_06065 [Saccharomonospora sp. CUA-673]
MSLNGMTLGGAERSAELPVFDSVVGDLPAGDLPTDVPSVDRDSAKGQLKGTLDKAAIHGYSLGALV